MEGISPEQLRSALAESENAFTPRVWLEPRTLEALRVIVAAARELLALKEAAPTHPDYDVALPEIEEWVNKSGAW